MAIEQTFEPGKVTICIVNYKTEELTRLCLQRDRSHNKAIAAQIKKDWKTYGSATGHSWQFLCFPWHIVEDRTRQTDLPPLKKNRTWARTWWWRWIFR